MQIVPKDSPALPSSTATSEGQKTARERAIAKLVGQPQSNPNELPVPNPSNVSVEELGAIQSPTKQIDTNEASAPQAASETTSDSVQAPFEAKKAPDESLSSQYAILARKEKAFRNQMAQFNAEKKALLDLQTKLLQQQTQATQQQPNMDAQLVARLKQDPLGVLEEQGLTWDQLTQQALNRPSPEQLQQQRIIEELRAENKAIKDSLDKVNKTFEERDTQSYKQAINQMTYEAERLVSEDPAFETIKATNSSREVVELIERIYKEEGRIISIEEAATEVENYLVDQALSLSKLKKIQERLKAPAAPTQQAAAQQKQPQAPQQQQLKTLTNSVSTSAKLSSRDRAILAFQGKLQKS